MKLIIDTNRIIAAMIRDGISRQILFSDKFEFVSPDNIITEIYEHEAEIIEKALIDNAQFVFVISLMLDKIKIIAKEEYEAFKEGATKLISDKDDVPFIAVALALKADGIWSDDKHFIEQDMIRVFNTKDMINLMV